MSSPVTNEQLQALFQRLDQLERELVDVRKTLNSQSTTDSDESLKRKEPATPGNGDVEIKKAKKTDVPTAASFGIPFI